MRIVLISDLETTGGAAIAASRLASGLLERGHQVERVVAIPDGNGNGWHARAIARKRSLAMRFVRRAVPGLGRALDRAAAENELAQALREARPDVISVHNLHYAQFAGWSEQMLRICAEHAPTVWTLHDMWSFTGRCIAAYDCDKFVGGCDATCPTADEYPALPPERIAGAWRAKQALLGELTGVVCVTPSKWMTAQAGRGLWKAHRREVIPNGLPLDTYRPLDRAEARRALGLPADGTVALFTGQVITDRRNGADLLLAALRRAKTRPITLVTLGQGELRESMPGLRIVPLGMRDWRRDGVLAYNAADFTAYAAPVGNLPNAIVESLACGTPVVALPTCGVPELVRAGVTGWLADEASADGLARALQAALRDLAAGVSLRDSCRKVAETEFDQALQAQRYERLFAVLCGAVPSAQPERKERAAEMLAARP